MRTPDRGFASVTLERVSVIEALEDRFLLAATKIMPLGDSITAGEVGHDSYRYSLWTTLQSNNYTNIDFVGSQTGVNGGSPVHTNFDQNNEGHWGWRTDEILGQISGWANTYRPDVVLMHLGTNDMFQSQSVSSTITELGSIIDRVRQYVPNVTFLVAQVIPATSSTTQLQQLDAQIPSLVSQKNTSQSKVILVDQWTGFNASTDTYDGIHPTPTGEQKMANKWYSALTSVLTPTPPTPLPGGTYLSDLTPTFASNGFGPYERDKSNGEENAGDGHTITLNGTTYAKGLGVHASSELRYNLGGTYSTFLADIGMDDEWGNNGSVVFQVWDNLGNKLYDSSTMTGATATKSISLNVAGKNEIRLIVTNGGDNDYYDHADWALARVTGTSVPAPVVNAFNGATINEAGTYTASGSFSDSGSGPWTATVNYGDGSGNQALTLNTTNKTFNLSHAYADNGSYTVTLTISNPVGPGSRTAAVAVTNVAPTITMPPSASVTYGNTWTASGSFTDPGTLDTFTATVNYGDGTPTQPLTLGANKTFSLSKSYTANGSYTVTVTITDKDSGTKTATTTVTLSGAPAATVTYVSDLTPTFANNGFGPYERNTSNGEENAGDGHVIKIAGTTYAKGLGVHAPSELRFDLTGGGYTTFDTDYGVDDEWGFGGSVTFQVWLDGVLAWQSPVMRSGQAAQHASINVAGKSQLKLVVTDGGDNPYYDHADWADAKLARAVPVGLSVNPITGGTLNEGTTYTFNGSFSDPGAGPWTATVNYGDGSGTQPLTIDPVTKTFALSHPYADNGARTVTVAVSNGTTIAQSTATVTVNNVVPVVSLGGASANSSPTFALNGSFADPGSDSWTATVDYGEGTGSHALSLNSAAKTFALSNIYAYNGTYSIKVTVVDDDGGSATSTILLNVTGGQNRPETYLSDLTPTFANNGFGPYERNTSNGEENAGDGHVIKIAGTTYAKGLGVHAPSELRFDLTGGGYTTFDTDYGVDDEWGFGGSVTFQVWLDGVLAWQSPVMRSGQAAQHASINVAGKSQLKLVVTDGGDNPYYDHADWASAKLMSG